MSTFEVGNQAWESTYASYNESAQCEVENRMNIKENCMSWLDVNNYTSSSHYNVRDGRQESLCMSTIMTSRLPWWINAVFVVHQH
jgi:hypothetical protein